MQNIPFSLWANSLYRLKKYKKAHFVIIRAMTVNEKNWFLLGKILNECGYYKDAEFCYERALRKDPSIQGVKDKLDKLKKQNFADPLRTSREPLIELEEPILPSYETDKQRNCEELVCGII